MFWEVNEEAPSIRVADPESEKDLHPFIRRCLVLEMLSTFTGEPSRVDIPNRVFYEDPTLRTWLQSPAARNVYMLEHLLPFMQRYCIDDCLDKLANPGEEIMSVTKEFVKQMARGGLRKVIEEAGPSAVH